MAVCCFSYTQLGCINACDPITLGTAPADGDYILEISFNDHIQVYQKHFLFFEPLEFDIPLNENANYKAKVILPHATSYMCYQFTTSPSTFHVLPDSIPTPP
jgi:hypothetical protein